MTEKIELSERELEEIVDRGVRKALLTLGLNTENAESVVALQSDFAYLRNLREGSKASRITVVTAVLASGITALGTLIWLGAQAAFGGGGSSPVPPPFGG